MEEITIRMFRDAQGRRPFPEWLGSLRDKQAIARIQIRLARLRSGNFGDCHGVGGGVQELRVFLRPGYRVYFALIDPRTVLLLNGGTKDTQRSDIAQAKEWFDEYRAQGGEAGD